MADSNRSLWRTPIGHDGGLQSVTMADSNRSRWRTPIGHDGGLQSVTMADSNRLSPGCDAPHALHGTVNGAQSPYVGNAEFAQFLPDFVGVIARFALVTCFRLAYGSDCSVTAARCRGIAERQGNTMELSHEVAQM